MSNFNQTNLNEIPQTDIVEWFEAVKAESRARTKIAEEQAKFNKKVIGLSGLTLVGLGLYGIYSLSRIVKVINTIENPETTQESVDAVVEDISNPNEEIHL